MRFFYSFVFLLLSYCSLYAQQPSGREGALSRIDSFRTVLRERIEATRTNYNADSVRAMIENGPYFGVFKDNYFIGGIPVGQKIKADNSNVKFQISVIQRLTKSKLPFDTYLFLQFTQKTVWNVLEESLPIRDMNFNPGIGIGHLIVYQNRYIGKAFLMLEHESNGKDREASRSWNKVSLSGSLMASPHVELQFKAWIPIIDGENNRDILRYNGLGHFGLSYRTSNRRIQAGILATWRNKSFSFNTQWELSYKLHKNENQYLFLQYYNGYGENLLDYDRFKSVVRLGMVIKPQDFSIF
ncbi:phospholipase A [Tannerella forsythia]|uniref:phospholipase A n=1 Tax=Tannerella forsythia TaxID=28112 RepID=UPI0028F0F9F3|nr:phospholipase A [Tannerella forsythia]